MFNIGNNIRKAGRLLRAVTPVTPPPPRINVLIPQAGPHPLDMAGGLA